VHGTEHRNEVLVDAAAGEHVHVTEEAHHVLINRGAHVHMAEKGHDITVHRSLGIYAAKKANRIVGGIVWPYVDVAEELHTVVLSTGRRSHK
jgi:molybdenum cofactor biosynthesis enzyme